MGRVVELRLRKLEQQTPEGCIIVVFDGETKEQAYQRSTAGDPLTPGDAISYCTVDDLLAYYSAHGDIAAYLSRLRHNDLKQLVDLFRDRVASRKKMEANL